MAIRRVSILLSSRRVTFNTTLVEIAVTCYAREALAARVQAHPDEDGPGVARGLQPVHLPSPSQFRRDGV